MKKTLISRGKLLDLSSPKIMAILNMTPDSFYAGSRWLDKKEDRLAHVKQLIEQGANVLDIGGYSTRPGALEVSEDEEIGRIVPIIKEIRSVKSWNHIWISVDTFRSRVAIEAVEAGADMINDVSGGNLDEEMYKTVAKLNVPYVLMHMRGTPQTMVNLDYYPSLVYDVLIDLHEKINKLQALGISEICIDPGFGFAKNLEQNYELLQKLASFYSLNLPILVGISRKSMIWKYLETSANDALIGTSALHALCIDKQIGLYRVHDVKEMKEVIRVIQKLESKKYAVK